MGDATTVGAVVSVFAVLLPFLFSHERRLTRIEGKLDVILRLLNKRGGDKK